MPFPAKTSTNAIIQSAADLIRAEGLAALSMRTLAARLGVRASSLYRHFPDRSAIEETLAQQASEHLLECMEQSVQGLTGERALFSAARAYLDYSLAEHSFYDLIMHSGIRQPADSEKTKRLWDFLLSLVSGTTQFADSTAGAAALWSFLHGFSQLTRMGMLGEDAKGLTFARGTEAIVRGPSPMAEPEIARAHKQG